MRLSQFSALTILKNWGSTPVYHWTSYLICRALKEAICIWMGWCRKQRYDSRSLALHWITVVDLGFAERMRWRANTFNRPCSLSIFQLLSHHLGVQKNVADDASISLAGRPIHIYWCPVCIARQSTVLNDSTLLNLHTCDNIQCGRGKII